MNSSICRSRFLSFPQRLTVAWICFLNAASDGETRHNAAHDEDQTRVQAGRGGARRHARRDVGCLARTSRSGFAPLPGGYLRTRRLGTPLRRSEISQPPPFPRAGARRVDGPPGGEPAAAPELHGVQGTRLDVLGAQHHGSRGHTVRAAGARGTSHDVLPLRFLCPRLLERHPCSRARRRRGTDASLSFAHVHTHAPPAVPATSTRNPPPCPGVCPSTSRR